MEEKMTDIEKKGVIEKLREIFAGQAVFLLTTVDWRARPRSRYMTGIFTEDGIIVGATLQGSAKVEQINENPWVSVSTIPTDGWTAPFFLMEGRCIIDHDPEARKKYWRDEFRSHFSGPTDPNYVLYMIKPVRVTMFFEGTQEVRILDEKFRQTF